MLFCFVKIMLLELSGKCSHLDPWGQGLQVNAGFCEIVLRSPPSKMAQRRRRRRQGRRKRRRKKRRN
jgi:hypothetical protein